MTITADLAKAGAVGGVRRRVVWTRGRRVTFGIIGFGSLLIALTGFVGSYTAVRDLATEKGFGWFATIFPLGIDIGIITMLALDLALTWVDLRYPLLRHIAWLLTVATVAFNAFSAYPDILASIMHGAIPLLFIAITEAVRHAIAVATAREEGREEYALSLGRWLLAPWSTWLIWRSRKLWPSTISSNEEALALYQDKLDYRRELRDAYGWRWRKKASREELRPLRRSRLGYAVRSAVDLHRSEPVAPPSQAVPATSVAALGAARPGPVPAPFPAPEPQDPAQADELSGPDEDTRRPSPPAEGERAVPAPAQDNLLEHPHQDLLASDNPTHGDAEETEDEAPAREPEPGTGPSDEPVQEQDSDEGADEAGPEEEDDPAAGPPPTIDLGPAPADESKRQRAERIYLAHQGAGVELTRKDLTRWAGYRNEGSGRSAYNDLERKHGPIVAEATAWESGRDELAALPS